MDTQLSCTPMQRISSVFMLVMVPTCATLEVAPIDIEEHCFPPAPAMPLQCFERCHTFLFAFKSGKCHTSGTNALTALCIGYTPCWQEHWGLLYDTMGITPPPKESPTSKLPADNEACMDLASPCFAWARASYCDGNLAEAEFMETNCRLSCGLCSSATTQVTPTALKFTTTPSTATTSSTTIVTSVTKSSTTPSLATASETSSTTTTRLPRTTVLAVSTIIDNVSTGTTLNYASDSANTTAFAKTSTSLSTITVGTDTTLATTATVSETDIRNASITQLTKSTISTATTVTTTREIETEKAITTLSTLSLSTMTMSTISASTGTSSTSKIRSSFGERSTSYLLKPTISVFDGETVSDEADITVAALFSAAVTLAVTTLIGFLVYRYTRHRSLTTKETPPNMVCSKDHSYHMSRGSVAGIGISNNPVYRPLVMEHTDTNVLYDSATALCRSTVLDGPEEIIYDFARKSCVKKSATAGIYVAFRSMKKKGVSPIYDVGGVTTTASEHMGILGGREPTFGHMGTDNSEISLNTDAIEEQDGYTILDSSFQLGRGSASDSTF